MAHQSPHSRLTGGKYECSFGVVLLTGLKVEALVSGAHSLLLNLKLMSGQLKAQEQKKTKTKLPRSQIVKIISY